jgi:hypothetical protein
MDEAITSAANLNGAEINSLQDVLNSVQVYIAQHAASVSSFESRINATAQALNQTIGKAIRDHTSIQASAIGDLSVATSQIANLRINLVGTRFDNGTVDNSKSLLTNLQKDQMNQIEGFEDYMSHVLTGSDNPALSVGTLLANLSTSGLNSSFVQRTNLRMASIRRADPMATDANTPQTNFTAINRTIPDALATVRGLFDSTQLKANGAASNLSGAVETAIANGNSAVSEIISLTKKALGL